MALDPRRLRPAEAARLLNSTPLGEVISERQIHRHRTRAGLRLAADGDPQRLDLYRYVAWLVLTRHELLARPEPDGPSGYDAARERARLRNAALSLSGRDIGPLPEVVDPARRAAAELSFRSFCESYLGAVFRLAWSADHLRVIAAIERAVLEGGLFAMAMPRGSGKTSLCEAACLWAMLYGHRDFIALVGSDEAHAAGMLASIQTELETSDLLLADFPEVAHPIRALEGIHQRAGGQLFEGKPTRIGWTEGELVLPTIPRSRASGAVIHVAGITGRIRGMKHKRPDGTSARPSLVLIDDPQTDESARSPTQCVTRERILAGAVLGLAGPGTKIAGLMTLTVVRPGDLADRLLDRAKHPQWQGERTKMVYAFPTDEALWARYAELRAEGLRSGAGIVEATEFYRKHRAEMDAGASVSWEERFNHDELSALQHAMNLRLQDEQAFFAEYQNEPLPEARPEGDALSAEEIAAKVNGRPRAEVPLACTKLTMFIDVQAKALFYLVAAWEEDCTGYILDYGTEPDQKMPYFTLRDLRRTLATEDARAGLEASLYAGLERLVEFCLGREWRRDDAGVGGRSGGGEAGKGSVARIDRCLIDANWGSSTDVVYQFCRQSRYAGIVMPCHGRYVGASSVPLSEYRRKPGERTGLNWRVPLPNGRREVRHVVFDTNYWKSFVQARLAVPMGDPGSLSIFGRAADQHRLLAEHLASEYRVRTQGRGRTVDEWKLRAEGQDNHWLDGLVGAAVAASMEGCAPPGVEPSRPRVRRRVTLAELKARADERRRLGLSIMRPRNRGFG